MTNEQLWEEHYLPKCPGAVRRKYKELKKAHDQLIETATKLIGWIRYGRENGPRPSDLLLIYEWADALEEVIKEVEKELI